MFDRIISEAMRAADIREKEFDAAVRKAGFKSRIEWFYRGAPASLIEAYNARVAAEGAGK